MIASLESGLRDELAETFGGATGGGEEALAMVREGNEELRLALAVIAEQRRAKRREEKKKRTLALLLAKEKEKEAEEERRRRGVERAEAERAKEALVLEHEEGQRGEEEGQKAKAIAQQESPVAGIILGVPARGG